MIDKEMEQFVNVGLLKQETFQYSSPIMHIARKNLHLKGIITELRFYAVGYRE